MYRASACLALGQLKQTRNDVDKALDLFENCRVMRMIETAQTLPAQALFAGKDTCNSLSN